RPVVRPAVRSTSMPRGPARRAATSSPWWSSGGAPLACLLRDGRPDDTLQEPVQLLGCHRAVAPQIGGLHSVTAHQGQYGVLLFGRSLQLPQDGQQYAVEGVGGGCGEERLASLDAEELHQAVQEL